MSKPSELELLSPAQYDELFLKAASSFHSDAAAATVAAAALETALDVRKFEIELYWKRTTYFWAFIAATLVAYCEAAKMSDTAQHSGHLLQELFGCAGLVFSFAWVKMNQGSKFWQANWEAHVDFLEGGIQGPLYKVIAENRGESARRFGARPYSVSRVNQLVSVFTFCVWFILLGIAVFQGSPHLHRWASRVLDERRFSYDILAVLGFVAALISCYLIHRCGKSGFAKHLTQHKKDETGIQFYRRS